MKNSTSNRSDPNEIPADIRERVLRDFGPEQGEEIYRYLLEKIRDGLPNGTRPRHLRGILSLAKGDREMLEKSIELCLMDPRDLIVAAEYEMRSPDDYVRLRDFAKPFDQADFQASKQKRSK